MNYSELILIFLPSIKKLIATFTDKNLEPDPELQLRLEALVKIMANYTNAGLNHSPDAPEIYLLAKSEAALIETRLKIKHGIAANLDVQNAIMYSLELALSIALLIK